MDINERHVMGRTKQQNEQDGPRAARFVTIRALTVVAVVTALAVSSAAVASAGTAKKPPPRSAAIVLIGANDYGLVANPPPRRPGAANNMSTLSLRKAPPKPQGWFLDMGAMEALD